MAHPRIRHKALRSKAAFPSQVEFLSLFELDPSIGVLVWKEQPNWVESQRYHLTGRPAGHIGANGYVRIRCMGRRNFLAHRVIWKMVTGKDPIANIDHINGVWHDNRITNLREATHAQNCMNRAAYIGRREPKGVYFSRGRYHAKIGIGSYDTMEEASAAYERVARLLYGEFAKSK